MDRDQRFLKRLYLMERMDLWLRELVYHRTNDDNEELLPQIPFWKWGEEEGQGKLDVVAEELNQNS